MSALFQIYGQFFFKFREGAYMYHGIMLYCVCVQGRLHPPHHHSYWRELHTAGQWAGGGALGRIQGDRGIQVSFTIIDKYYNQMGKVNRLRNRRVDPFAALFWALAIVLAYT